MVKTQNQADETAKKNKIVEKEQVVINENDIISGEELKENDVIDVNAPEVIIKKEQGAAEIEEQTMSAENTVEKTANEEGTDVESESTETTEEITEPLEENEKKEKTSRKTNNKKSDSEKIWLKIRIAFTDKYNDREYKENDIVEFEKDRASELLSDTRRLFEKVD